MARSLRRILAFAVGSITVIAAVPIFTTVGVSAAQNGEGEGGGDGGGLAGINHLVVIYDENHSFDNLYGSFPRANGINRASATSTTQVTLAGTPYTALPQTDIHIPTNLPNQPFDITKYVPANQKTRDLVHRYYQEQVQIDGGKMDKFVAVSDAAGLSMGYYPTAQLPVANEAANYVLADNFFHAAFGGSFLNHQWLVCACTPVYAGAVKDGTKNDLHTVLGANGLPTKDGQLTTAATGDYAVNTIFPASTPTINGAPQLPLLTNKTIGDELSAEDVSWAWYSGGWNAANSPAGAPSLFLPERAQSLLSAVGDLLRHDIAHDRSHLHDRRVPPVVELA